MIPIISSVKIVEMNEGFSVSDTPPLRQVGDEDVHSRVHSDASTAVTVMR